MARGEVLEGALAGGEEANGPVGGNGGASAAERPKRNQAKTWLAASSSWATSHTVLRVAELSESMTGSSSVG